MRISSLLLRFDETSALQELLGPSHELITVSADIVLIGLNIERRMPYSPKEEACGGMLPCHGSLSLYSPPFLLSIFRSLLQPLETLFSSLLFYKVFPDFTARTNLSLLWTPISPCSYHEGSTCPWQPWMLHVSFIFRTLDTHSPLRVCSRELVFFLPIYFLSKTQFPLSFICSS